MEKYALKRDIKGSPESLWRDCSLNSGEEKKDEIEECRIDRALYIGIRSSGDAFDSPRNEMIGEKGQPLIKIFSLRRF